MGNIARRLGSAGSRRRKNLAQRERGIRLTISSTLEGWIGAGTYVTLRGHRMFTRTAITPGKEPLLLIHGYPTASYDWHRLWPGLAERYSLYALDVLGFGLSSKPRNAT